MAKAERSRAKTPAAAAGIERSGGDEISKSPAKGPRTLAIDIGGTGLKAKVLDAKGQALTERLRIETPRPATPEAVLRALAILIDQLGEFDRVSVGFPGVVVAGTTKTAPNLHERWSGYALAAALEKRTGKPTRVLNDAGVQGHGVVSGHGVEMVLTLGTGMGCALFTEGHYVPNLELAHHPFGNGKTYEQFISDRARKRIGNSKWSRRVLRVLAQIQPIFNPTKIYLGGGNSRRLEGSMPSNVTIVDNAAGLFGGIALWRDDAASVTDTSAPAKTAPRAKTKTTEPKTPRPKTPRVAASKPPAAPPAEAVARTSNPEEE